ncbi:uncharacterized protein LOC125152736 isoform X2 [Prionailurus viverrinus]|uniref:uncharacterized protein LOC125152736 isoform X2 n=1 Tax=Prionailurus viverrinus TaxID=61388 RepID=UPI001FF18AF2|nr:uncharacterized protein LOC125152736 isoform X2 [Prionailurus viverrinus]
MWGCSVRPVPRCTKQSPTAFSPSFQAPPWPPGSLLVSLPGSGLALGDLDLSDPSSVFSGLSCCPQAGLRASVWPASGVGGGGSMTVGEIPGGWDIGHGLMLYPVKGSVPGDGGAVGKRRDLFSTFKGVCSESSRCERNPVKSRVAGADMVSSWEEDRKFILRGWSLVFSILAALMMLSVVDGRLAYLQGSYTGYLGFWTDCRKYKCVSLGQVTVLIHMSMGFMMLALTLCLILLPFMCLSFRPVFRRLTKIDLVFSFLSFSTGFLIVLSLTLFVVNCETLLPRPQVSYLVTTYLCWGAGALMLLAAERSETRVRTAVRRGPQAQQGPVQCTHPRGAPPRASLNSCTRASQETDRATPPPPVLCAACRATGWCGPAPGPS